MGDASRVTRVTGEARETMARQVSEQYRAGASIREIASATGRSYGFIHRLLLESDVVLRGRGGATRSRRRPAG